MKTLQQYIPSGSRHRLLFTSHYPEGVVFMDMGVSLSMAIEPLLSNRRISLIADETIDDIIKSHIVSDPEIGEYVAIRNIGILFEPALQLDLHAKFSSWSKTYALIVDVAEGSIKNDVFYLAGTNDQSYSINLSDIPYKTYYDEI